MPIWLRRFYFKCMQESYKEEREAQEKANKNQNKHKVAKPGINR